MTEFDASRRQFLKTSMVAGVGVYVASLGSPAFAALFEDEILSPTDGAWDLEAARMRFRLDGVAKVTGSKVFARDIRARDMPHWPDAQSHAFILRTTRCDQTYEGFDLSRLQAEGLMPDRLVTADDLARDAVEVPAFYGSEFLLPEGRTPLYLGYPVAILIYHDFDRYAIAKNRLKFKQDVIRYGRQTGYPQRKPYGTFRYIRVGGEDAYDADVYSALQETVLIPDYRKRHPIWPEALKNGSDAETAMYYAHRIDDQLAHPPEGWEVFEREYYSQLTAHFAMEPDNTNCWYDPDSGAMHFVGGTQSPAELSNRMPALLAASRFTARRFFLHPVYTVGYGSKDASIFPYYGLITALYADGRPVRLANDRFEQFQATMKRHPFSMRHRIAVDRDSGKFRIFKLGLDANGGGRANYSNSVAFVGATAAQGIYYFPNSDLTATANYSRMPTAGSYRGYGTLQTMSVTEMMVDELADKLGIDPIEFRLRNVMKAGMKNTQGAIPAGASRADEILHKARRHPLWTERRQRKKAFEAAHPGKRYGVGFGCVQKDFGHGAEGVFSEVELTRDGRIRLRNIGAEMGTGYSTSQAAVCAQWLGRAADEISTAQTEWPDMQMETSGNPYIMPQEEQERLARNPRWTPLLMQASSASNSAYYFSFPTIEAARLIFKYGLWPAAMAYWSRGIGGGQAAPFVVRESEAHWVDGKLTASGMEPLSLEFLAQRAHEMGLVTAVMAHAFNRWAWATAEYELEGQRVTLPLDGLAVKYGAGAGPAKQRLMTSPRGYHLLTRANVHYPPTQRNNAGVTYYSACGTLVELAVDKASGEVELLNHHTILECGNPIVPELVSGQLQGGVAMGIGHALYEDMPLYEDGPGNGTWNINRYRVPRANDVAVWKQTSEILPPLSASDPNKGVAEVVMIPVIPAIANGIAQAIGHRFNALPITPDKIKEVV